MIKLMLPAANFSIYEIQVNPGPCQVGGGFPLIFIGLRIISTASSYGGAWHPRVEKLIFLKCWYLMGTLMETLAIDRKKTAIVVIDLQKGIASRPTKPYSPSEVITNAAKLVGAFRKNSMPVFLVHVNSVPELALKPLADEAMLRPAGAAMPADWAEFVPELSQAHSDIVINKRQWGAFYGTDLDLQLRRRGLDTFVLCGIATDYGVESTARFAYEYGFRQVFVEDAMSSRSAEQHEAAVKFVLRRIGKVRSTDEILKAIG